MKKFYYLLITLIFISCAKEELLNTYNLNINNTEGGSVIGQEGIFEEGTSTLLIASPESVGYINYKFSHWKVNDKVIYDNPITLTITSNLSITPVFTKRKMEEDEVYSQITEDALKTYLSAFIKDAKRWGVDLSHVNIQDSFFEWVTDESFMAASIAYNQPSVVYIKLNTDYWKGLSKEDKIKVMWHEFGHDILGLDHLCMGGEIMSGQHQNCKGPVGSGEYFNVYGLHYNDSNNETNFQRAINRMFNKDNQIFLDSRTSFTSKGSGDGVIYN